MIRSLRIKNFKCFIDESFELRPMNILCGENAVGKSSFIQSLLLMRETSTAASVPRIVRLNGPFFLELGQVADVLNHNNRDNNNEFIEFSLNDSYLQEFKWHFPFDASNTEDSFLRAENVPQNPPSCFTSEESCVFTFLSAERLGPRDTQKIQSVPKKNLQVGVRGEFTDEVLIRREFDKVRKSLLYPCFSEKQGRDAGTVRQEKLSRLGKQVELWMQDLVPGIEIRSHAIPDTNAASIRMKKGGLETEWLRPANIGFGVSYSLPIIIAGLLSPPESLFIVDSPEAHLHPAAQSVMARFLSVLAAGGVQVVIETHSDHIINGIRVSTADDGHPLKTEDTIIHNFYHDQDSEFQTLPIEITRTGSLSRWPKGFLDQTERDLAAILKARRKNV